MTIIFILHFLLYNIQQGSNDEEVNNIGLSKLQSEAQNHMGPLIPKETFKGFIKRIDESAPALMKKYGVHGAAVSFIENGRVVFKKYYGYANIEEKIKVTRTTGFNVASVSKNITAWAILGLVEEGKLALDDPVENYLSRWQLPVSDFNSKEVTIRRVLSHTAGLSQHGYPGYYSSGDLPSIEDVLSGRSNVDEAVKIIYQPGKKFKYSGGGYTILQLIIEEVTGTSFERYLQSILQRLNMRSSSFTIDNKVLSNSSLAYKPDGEKMPLVLFTAKAAAGLHTTLEDLTNLALAGFSGTLYESENLGILMPETVKLMTSRVSPSVEEGLGYQINSFDNGEIIVVGYEGNNYGWNAYYRIDRKRGDGFVVLTNGGTHRNIYHPILSQWIEWKSNYSRP